MMTKMTLLNRMIRLTGIIPQRSDITRLSICSNINSMKVFSYPTLIRTRNCSTYDCSLVQLADDIDTVYKDLNYNFQFFMSSLRLGGIKHQILSKSYFLSPLKMNILENGEQLSFFLNENFPDFPDIMYGSLMNSEKSFAIMPNNKEDNLVLMALSVMLLRLSLGSLQKKGLWIEDMVFDFHDNLKRMENVNKVYKVNVQQALGSIPISLVEEKIQSLVGDESPIFKLVSSFLRLPIFDDDGNNCKGVLHLTGIPVVGEITKVLFNLYLMDTFDKSFPLRFPGIAFSRFMNEIFIMTNDKVLFDCKHVYKLLGEHRLLGNLTSMGPDDEPLLCHFNKLIYLGSNGKIDFCDPQDYS